MNFAQPVLDFLGDDARADPRPGPSAVKAGRWSNAMSVPPLVRRLRQD